LSILSAMHVPKIIKIRFMYVDVMARRMCVVFGTQCIVLHVDLRWLFNYAYILPSSHTLSIEWL